MFAEIPFWPFLVPIFAIVFGCGIAMVAIYTNYRKRRDIYSLHHRERMAAIEKGVEVPPLPEAFFTEETTPYSPRRNLLKGLVWLMLGLTALLALYQEGDEDVAWFGLIPMGIGAAYLIYYFAVGRKEAEALELAAKAKLAETKPRSAV